MVVSIFSGQSVSVTRVFEQSDYDRFARLSGDDNPIHVDPEFAATTRFGKTLAHGMLLFATAGAVIGTVFPGPGTQILEQELMFPGPTFTGEEMTIRIDVVSVSEDAARAELAVNIQRPDGSPSLIGRSIVALPRGKEASA